MDVAVTSNASSNNLDLDLEDDADVDLAPLYQAGSQVPVPVYSTGCPPRWWYPSCWVWQPPASSWTPPSLPPSSAPGCCSGPGTRTSRGSDVTLNHGFVFNTGQNLSNHLLRYLHLLISLLTSDSLNSLLLGLQLFCGSYLPVVLQVG